MHTYMWMRRVNKNSEIGQLKEMIYLLDHIQPAVLHEYNKCINN